MKLRYIAQHEACHAVVAIKMGLPVEWVDVHPGFAEGIHFGAAVSIPDDRIDMERDILAICVSMAAPSFLHSHRQVEPDLYHYANMEANTAFEIAGRAGHDWDEVYDLTSNAVSDHHAEIMELAVRLEAEGKVVFDLV